MTTEQRQYFVAYKKQTPFHLLKLVLKNWFFAASLEKNAFFIFKLFYSAWWIAQVLIFPLAFPLLVIISWPLSIYMNRGKKRRWLYWSATLFFAPFLLGVVLVSVFGYVETMAILMSFFCVQSIGLGIFMYKDLYNQDNVVVGHPEA